MQSLDASNGHAELSLKDLPCPANTGEETTSAVSTAMLIEGKSLLIYMNSSVAVEG